ncbi:MAG: universal stress protein [Rhodococcus sp.]|uniref:universal stress protein n=1 Tax=Rhodococcus TaxID=1827 RepID=UPI0016A6F1C0|nr:MULTISPECIES: universal stress protein [Rhodococcus]NLV78913.1 universal stress protein [Rhodococcus sp. (in: high G+C Gram-positive bacteria)]
MSVAVVHADSEEGRVALRAAAREAADLRTSLIVLHPLDDPADAGVVTAAVRDILGEGDWEVLADVHDGDPVGSLVALLERSGASRLVAGSRGRTATGKFLLERGLQRLIVESPVPVLVVKES